MKAIVDSQQLAKELKKAAPAIKKTVTLPILTSVKLSFGEKKLTIQATDIETTIKLTMDCECKKPFEILLEFAELFDLCSKLYCPLTFDASGDKILIISDDSKHKFAKMYDEKNFPPLPDEEFLFSIDVNSDFFWSLACADTCKSQESLNVRLSSTSVKFQKDKVIIAGTDAVVAYRNELKIKTGKVAELMVCEKFVQMVKGFDDAKVYVGEKFIKVETQEIVIASLLVDAKFVDLDVILPTEINYNFKVNRNEFISKLKVTGIASSITIRTVEVRFLEGTMVKLFSNDIDFGKEAETTLRAEYEVGFESIGINGNQILKLLGLFDSEEVEIAFESPRKAIMIRPAGEPNIISLIMPIALTNN